MDKIWGNNKTCRISHWKVPEWAKGYEWEHSLDLREGDYVDRVAYQYLCFPEKEFSHSKDFKSGRL